MNRLSGNWPAHQITTLTSPPNHPVLLQMLKVAERNIGQAYLVSWPHGGTTYYVEVLVLGQPMMAKSGRGGDNVRWIFGEHIKQERRPIWTHFTGDLGLIVELLADAAQKLSAAAEAAMQKQTNAQPELARRTGRFNAIKMTKNALPTISPANNNGNVTLSGELHKVELMGILQSINICKMTGRLDLQDGIDGIEIYVEEGFPVHACQIKVLNIVEEKPIVGDAVLLSALIWEKGSFSFNPERKTSDRSIKRKLEVLLLEGACLKDYNDYLLAANVKTAAVLHTKFGSMTEQAFEEKMSAGMPIDLHIQRKVYDCFDGKATVADITSRLGLQKPVWIPILFNLLSCNMISLEESQIAKKQTAVTRVIDPSLVVKAEREMARYETGFLTFPLFMLFLQKEMDRFSDSKQPFVLVIFEILHKGKRMSNEQLQKVASSFKAIASSYDLLGHYGDFEFAMLLPLKGENECREFVDVFQKFVSDSIDPTEDSDTVKMVCGIATADGSYDDSFDYQTFVTAATKAKQANKERRTLCTSARQLRWEELREKAEVVSKSADSDALAALWKKLYEESLHMNFDRAYWMQAAEKNAGFQMQMGRYSQAEPIVRDLLQYKTETLGVDDITTISTAGELAHCLYAQGKYADAEWLIESVLNSYSKHYGTDFPVVATWYYNLGMLYHVQQKYPSAEPMYKMSLDIRMKIFGPDHPDTKKSQATLDGLLAIMQPSPAAEPEPEPQLITGSWAVFKDTEQSLT